MTDICFLNITANFTGLCNQLLNLIATICQYYKSGGKIIVINHFLSEAYTNNYTKISNIINLEKTNLFLQKYNIVIVDTHNIRNFNIVSAIYGTTEKNIDVSTIIKKIFIKNNILTIGKNIDLNRLFTDPIIGHTKKLTIEYSLDDILFKTDYLEQNSRLINDININFNLKNNKYTYQTVGWHIIDLPENKEFSDLLYKNIIFHDTFINKSNEFLTNNNIINNLNKNVNVIHLRVEQDAINHWSKMNKIDKETFKKLLIEKYINLITSSIKNDDKTIVLSYSLDNEVINYMKENGYEYCVCMKEIKQNREENAIIDLLNSKACNNVFIGAGGSTFSQVILKNISPKKTLMFDLNNIFI
jgi:hypothetical protein